MNLTPIQTGDNAYVYKHDKGRVAGIGPVTQLNQLCSSCHIMPRGSYDQYLIVTLDIFDDRLVF